MNTEQERAAFEAWAEGKAELHKMTSGEYSARPTRLARDAWQAALESQEVQVLRDALSDIAAYYPNSWAADRANKALAAMEKKHD